MATIQKRKKSWRAMVRRKGKTVTATFDTKAQAEAWAISTEAKILEGFVVEAIVRETLPPPEGISMTEALKRYADEVSSTKRGARWEQIRIKAFMRNDSQWHVC
ncbi:hypothetical protein [Novosphingobium sediminicola]|uniref:Uncharacterized protein n=1 Tax=Novosphingobium sediminicola TaxID=563162 RepID=A0A7W6CII9_9SPHN|nr:hypothetical protein [Novosphingobium sediminicola]MBB3955294.1 hypothetical protein [Novosphingobium sediminicola]